MKCVAISEVLISGGLIDQGNDSNDGRGLLQDSSPSDDFGLSACCGSCESGVSNGKTEFWKKDRGIPEHLFCLPGEWNWRFQAQS